MEGSFSCKKCGKEFSPQVCAEIENYEEAKVPASEPVVEEPVISPVNAEVRRCVNSIIRQLNYMGCEGEVAKAVVEELRVSHRTLQQNWWKMVQAVAKEYAGFEHDLRNEDAVRFAKKVSEVDDYMRFI